MIFADADDSLENADYAVVGFPLDQTTTHRHGTDKAPQRIREASRGYESYHPETDVDLADVGIHDYGDLDAWHPVRETVDFAADVVTDLAGETTPVLLGGEHTVSVAGFRGTDADTLVSLDAHLDLKQEFQGRTFGHASVSRIALEDGLEVHVAGARSGSRKEWRYAEENEGIHAYDVDSLDGVVDAVEGDLYLSVDLDVIEPGLVPGVGTPEPYGVHPHEVKDVLAELAPRCVGFDVVEAAPTHDSGEAVHYAAGFVRDFVAYSR